MHCNDSWKYIENSLHPTDLPYPYHLIATSLHYFSLYIIISIILPSSTAIIVSIFIIQFSASLATLYLLYSFFLETFELDTRSSLVLIFIFDFIFISPYLLLATSEILFLFYQMLAWTCLVRQKYFFATISTAMTFALRFNGAFFVVGVILVLFLKWWKKRDLSPRLFTGVAVTGIIMFIIGFSSYILSWIYRGDFWLPLTTQIMKYQTMQEYATEGALSLPFLWWPTYFQYAIMSNSHIQLVLLMMAVFTFGLGFFSLLSLYKWSKRDVNEYVISLLFIYLCGFLGLNVVVSGRNFSRFLSYTFPIFSVIPIWLREHHLSSFTLVIFVIGAGIWGLFFNIIWWLTYPF
ncbi:MAG: hypothetical protein ACFFB5_00435 [Promethearchaeota archaeon]